MGLLPIGDENPKHEIRNPKEMTNDQFPMTKSMSSQFSGIWSLGFGISFGFRALSVTMPGWRRKFKRAAVCGRAALWLQLFAPWRMLLASARTLAASTTAT